MDLNFAICKILNTGIHEKSLTPKSCNRIFHNDKNAKN